VRSRKSGLVIAALTAGALAVPATAGAASTVIVGDAGVPEALAGQTIRNMAPQIAVNINGTTERSFTYQVIGPAGQVAASSICSSSTTPRTITYQGNGAYTVNVAIYSTLLCTDAPATGTSTFAIAAGVASLGPAPAPRLLTRRPDSFTTIEYRLPITGNLGADTYDIVYSANPALAPDGGLVGPSQNAYVESATATVPFRFSKPGAYSVVSRARVYGGAATPWTAPLVLRAVAPFDFTSVTFPDSTGPSYRLRAKLGEESTRGKVRIRVAANWSGKARYRSLGTVKIKGGGEFTKRFVIGNPGKYRLKYTFGGSSTTATGTIVEKVRIRRTVRFAEVGDAGVKTLTAAP
jgi:hypothetical protein